MSQSCRTYPRSATVAAWAASVLVTAVAFSGALADPGDGSRPEGPGDLAGEPSVADLVGRYFLQPDARGRKMLSSAVAKASGGDPFAVASAMAELTLWAPVPGDEDEMVLVFEPSAGASVNVLIRLPASYDPSKAYPMLLCLPDDGIAPVATLSSVRDEFGPAVDGFLLACPARRISGRFQQSVHQSGDFRALVLAVRKAVHTDTDRLYLFGRSAGGDAVWITALNHADLLAGVVVVDSFPRLPYAQEAYPWWLANLAHVPVLSAWRMPAPTQSTTRGVMVAEHNRYISLIAQEADLPFVGLELPADDQAAMSAFRKAANDVFQTPRVHRPREVSCWFRYPDHGSAYVVRQTKFAGDVWTDDQIAILPASAVDRGAYIAEVLQGKLAHLGARVAGNRIDLQTRSCTRVEIDVPLAGTNWDEPVVVTCNGQPRRDDVLRPNIATMLSAAYQAWSFQHPVGARVSLVIRTPVKR